MTNPLGLVTEDWINTILVPRSPMLFSSPNMSHNNNASNRSILKAHPMDVWRFKQ